MKAIILLILLVSVSFSQDTIEYSGKKGGKNVDFYRFYDRMTHIVCYIYKGYNSVSDKMQCFDVNNERLKLKSTGKDKKERKEENENSYNSDY